MLINIWSSLFTRTKSDILLKAIQCYFFAVLLFKFIPESPCELATKLTKVLEPYRSFV